MKAIWKNTVIAESDDTVIVEGNHYFPTSSVNREFLEPSETRTNCYWKGTANYYNLRVNGSRNEDAVWYYPSPKPEAHGIEGRMAFWKGVKVLPS